jgi:hypothetical protein
MFGKVISSTFFLTVVSVSLAGPLEVTEKIVEKASDTALGITNSVTGGVTSQGGKVTASGTVKGNVTNAAIGADAKARTSVGSNRGTTAKGDISATGVVQGNLTNVSVGKGTDATTTIGSNGN